jgi:hypothetical protein
MDTPVDGTDLRGRDEFQRAVERLYESVSRWFGPGDARLRPGETGAFYPDADAGMEGFSRLLWGVAPLAAGGYAFPDWDRFRRGLVNGTDPDHEAFWGEAGDHDQKHVEMAAIGVALALTGDALWEPLSADERERVASWLGQTNDATLPDCNWLWFRVLTNLGLRSVGAPHDPEQVRADLDRLDAYALGDGWYADGTDDGIGPRDHYVAWEFHVDGLLSAALTDGNVVEGAEAGHAETSLRRAREFAGEYVHWFDDRGRALPYGRSLTYRFAQAAFWGALAFADALPEGFSWGQVRGLWARNVRWWLDQPVFTDGGALSIGYRYPNLKMAEPYNSPSGPYWALKAALPLALPASHPFWVAEEEPLPDLPSTEVQRQPNLLVCRDDGTDHHYALSAGQQGVAEGFGTDHEKYAKFAYSTAFGVGVATGRLGLLGAGHDSALALGRDSRHFRLREEPTEQSVSEDAVYSRWRPFDDVRVDTWLVPTLPWHVRVHRVQTPHEIYGAEGGFALDRTGDDDPAVYEHRTGDALALARYPAGTSLVVDPLGGRSGSVVVQDSNVNLHHQRTVVPTLTERLDAGETWLAAGVVASPDPGGVPSPGDCPAVALDGDSFAVEAGDGTVVYEGGP